MAVSAVVGRGHFWPQAHNLTKLSRCLLNDVTYQISSIYALWFQTRIFFIFFFLAYVNHVTHGARAIFGPRDII